MYRFFLLACVFVYLVPIPARAGAISVSPNSGSMGTPFILSVGGWSRCTGSGCVGQITVQIGNRFVYSQPGVEPFSVDLSQLDPDGGGCASCLPNGTHTVRVEGFHECAPSCQVSEILCTTFTVVDSSAIGDPWDLSERALNNTPGVDFGKTAGVLFRFFPDGPAGFPACDSVHLVQVVRETGLYHVSPSRPLTAAEQTAHSAPALRVWADSLDAWTTPAGYHIDISRGRPEVPYQTVGRPYFFSKPGRSSPSDTARVLDAPTRLDQAYPDSVVAILLDFEISAFCAAGAGRGQYLGRAIWQWNRTKGAPTNAGELTSWPPLGSLGAPTTAFQDAVERWAQHKGFKIPEVAAPRSGGTTCP